MHPRMRLSILALDFTSGGHVAGSVQKVTLTLCGAPLDVLCDILPVFEHVDQLVCLDIKDPQEVGLAMLPTTTRLQHTVCSSATCDCSLACCMCTCLILHVATGVCNICTYTYNVLLCKSTKVNSDTSIYNCYFGQRTPESA